MKWENLIKKMTTEQLHEEDFKERIKKGALYFHSELTEIFSRMIELTKEVQTNNKIGAKRFDNAYTELKQTYLQSMICQKAYGRWFLDYYLPHSKARGYSQQYSDGNERKRRKRKEDKDKPKEKKISTSEQTYNLFKTGKSVEEIAKERGLTQGTIQGHLVSYILNGDIKLEEVIDEKENKYHQTDN